MNANSKRKEFAKYPQAPCTAPNDYGTFLYWYAKQLIDIVHVSQTDDLFLFMLHLWNKWKLFIPGL